MERKRDILILILAAILLFNFSAFTQTRSILRGSNIKPFTISGNASVGGQLYNANGIANRRAPALGEGRVNVN